MNSNRIIGTFLFCILAICSIRVAGQYVGQERTKDNKVEVLDSNGFEVSAVKLEKISGQSHLAYQITNTSGVDLSKISLEMIAYDVKKNVLGGKRMIMRGNFMAGTGSHGLVVIDPKLASATQITLKFSALSSDKLVADESGCTSDFCGPNGDCGSLALLLCAAGVDNYKCKQGNTCVCDFTCTPLPPAN